MIFKPNRFYKIIVGLTLTLKGFSQVDTVAISGITPQMEAADEKWFNNLYEIGVAIEGDSIRITEEAKRVAVDSQYRKVIYPAIYTWQEAQSLMKQMQLKIGFWYLINIYREDPASRENVLKYILTFESILEMDKVLISVFYTYGLLDPESTLIVNGKPDIQHPEIVEQKLSVVKEIVNYIMVYRKQNDTLKSKN